MNTVEIGKKGEEITKKNFVEKYGRKLTLTASLLFAVFTFASCDNRFENIKEKEEILKEQLAKGDSAQYKKLLEESGNTQNINEIPFDENTGKSIGDRLEWYKAVDNINNKQKEKN